MASFISGLVSGNVSAMKDMKKDDGSGKTGRKAVIPRIVQHYRKKKNPMTDSPISGPSDNMASPVVAKRGAKKIKKTGFIKVHKGERVLTKKQAEKSRRMGRSKSR